MISEEIKTEIMPYVEKLSDQIGDEPEVILADFERLFNSCINVGMEQNKATKTALNSVRASYSKLIKLGAKMYEGFFIAGTEKRDRNSFIKKEAIAAVERFAVEHGSLWKAKAIAEKMIDDKGNYLITQDIIDTQYGGNPNVAWMLGRAIKVDIQKTAWAFVKEYGTDDDYTMVNAYINEPDEFEPIFGKLYKFRAVIKTSAAGKENMTMYKTISTLKPLETKVSYEDVEEYISIFEENIKSFEDAYDDDVHIGVLPESPAPKFCITEVVIGSVSQLGENKKIVEVLEQSAELDAEPISFDIPTEYSNGIYDGAMGIMVYRPFYRTKKDVDKNPIGKMRSGSMLGFIPNSDFAIAFDKEISDAPYQEDYE